MKNVIILLIVLMVTGFAFLPAIENGFVNWDDSAYLYRNQQIKELTLPNIKNIFSSYVNSNYQPLSVLSFALEYHFAGLNPKPYHITNVILHVFNTALVYVFIFGLAGNKTTAAIAALLFGIHPMRVESVAWVTERKDVLFAFFYILSLIIYTGYSRRQRFSPVHYGGAIFMFILSVLAKPAAVTLPLVLFLIDYFHKRKFCRRVVFEKIPFFAISLAAGLVALYGTHIPTYDNYTIAQILTSAEGPLVHFAAGTLSVIDRILLMNFAVLAYLGKLFWVGSASCYYPYAEKVNGLLPAIYYVSPVITLVGVGSIIRYLKEKREIIFGLVFFLLTISINLPLGFVDNDFAERFTYLPYIGLFYILAEGMNSFYQKVCTDRTRLIVKIACMGTALMILSGLVVQTRNFCQVWKNGDILWSNVIAQFPRATVPYNNRASYYISQGYLDAALKDLTSAVSVDPDNARGYINRGYVYSLKKENRLALADYNKALTLNPSLVEGYVNRAISYVQMAKPLEALRDCEMALRLSPNNEKAKNIKEDILKMPGQGVPH